MKNYQCIKEEIKLIVFLAHSLSFLFFFLRDTNKLQKKLHSAYNI